MTTSDRTPARPAAGGPDRAWLLDLAKAAAGKTEAPLDLVVEYLGLLADVAISGRRPRDYELAIVRELGRRAAEQGIPAGRVVDLYLSAAWRMWRDLPDVVPHRDRDAVRASAQAVLRGASDAIAVLVDSYQAATRQLIRHEESLRRELVDDLLRGDSDLSRIVERAEPFGLDLGRAHHVVLATSDAGLPEGELTVSVLERFVLDQLGDRDVLVATKDDLLVVLIPAVTSAGVETGGEIGGLMQAALTRHREERRWRVATGRAYPGAYGIARSYEEAREALVLTGRLRLQPDVVTARDMLIYRVLVRDQAAIGDLITSVLGPLGRARGGAEPLVATLEAYFAAGEVATEAARRINVAVRTITYRLGKIRTLTGLDPGVPTDRFTLQAAVLGARLLEWPERELPSVS
ncbi:PucR family transcriptional regulator [Kribbella lupini]|uniref:Helix-turn-helix domain-containing protein n=1 Tax=Kribbella lupini TaxID=291602 RepID=A0ABN2AML4_9ACTN